MQSWSISQKGCLFPVLLGFNEKRIVTQWSGERSLDSSSEVACEDVKSCCDSQKATASFQVAGDSLLQRDRDLEQAVSARCSLAVKLITDMTNRQLLDLNLNCT